MGALDTFLEWKYIFIPIFFLIIFLVIATIRGGGKKSEH